MHDSETSRPNVLRWANHCYPITHMDQQNEDMPMILSGPLIAEPPQKAGLNPWLPAFARSWP